MGLLDLFSRKPKGTAAIAKERLRIIVAQERAQRDSPDYLPTLRRELLEVIRKYVHVEADHVSVHVGREGGQDILELNVVLPDGASGRK